jgi:beta-lactamase class A
MPSGQRYVATAMVQRPHNDPRAQELIRQVSRTVYQALNQPESSAGVAGMTPSVAASMQTVPQSMP